MCNLPRRPIIGCTEPSAFTPEVLVAIEKFFNGNPFKICQNHIDDIHYWIDQCDAVILAGGADIHPRIYGYTVLNNYNFSRFDIYRDIREIKIIRRCFAKKIPILGICRGHQMLGVYHTMKVIPDLAESVVCHQPNYQKIQTVKEEPMHWVRLLAAAEEKYTAVDIVGNELYEEDSKRKKFLWVNSFHHQGLLHRSEDGYGDGAVILGVSPGLEKQQIIELMRGKTNSWISCQWHPEYDWEVNAASRMIFTKFADMINEHMNQKESKNV